MIEKNNNLVVDKYENDNQITIYCIKNQQTEKNKKLIQKIDSIKYIGVCELEESEINDEGIFEKFIIDFSDSSDSSNSLELKEPILNLLVTLQKLNIKNPLFKILEFFQNKNNPSLIVENIIGDVGEALLIWKCIELGYGPLALSKLRPRDNDLYDFSFDNNTIEVKTTSTRTKEVKINHDQMPNDNDNNLYILVVNVKFVKKVNYNHKSILDIYEMIESKIDIKNSILQYKKSNYKTYDEKIIDYNSIDINDYSFSILQNNELNKIKLKDLPQGVKDLIYVFDVSNSEKISDETLVRLIK